MALCILHFDLSDLKDLSPKRPLIRSAGCEAVVSLSQSEVMYQNNNTMAITTTAMVE